MIRTNFIKQIRKADTTERIMDILMQVYQQGLDDGKMIREEE